MWCKLGHEVVTFPSKSRGTKLAYSTVWRRAIVQRERSRVGTFNDLNHLAILGVGFELCTRYVEGKTAHTTPNTANYRVVI